MTSKPSAKLSFSYDWKRSNRRFESMVPVTRLIAVPFLRPEHGGDIFIGKPKQAGSADSAIRMAGLLAVLEGSCGAGAFIRTEACGYSVRRALRVTALD
jgi:hypothetical protein